MSGVAISHAGDSHPGADPVHNTVPDAQADQ